LNALGPLRCNLFNRRSGELVVPAVVTGTFSTPKFAPDVQQIAQTKVRDPAPNFDNPASVTGAKSARRSKEPFTSHAVTRR